MPLFSQKFNESTFNRTCCFSVIFAECRRGGGGSFGHPRHAHPHHSLAFAFPLPEAFLPQRIPRCETSWGHKYVQTQFCLFAERFRQWWTAFAHVCFLPVLCRSPESRLLSSVLISSGFVDHPSLRRPGETEACLWCTSGPAFRLSVYSRWEWDDTITHSLWIHFPPCRSLVFVPDDLPLVRISTGQHLLCVHHFSNIWLHPI